VVWRREGKRKIHLLLLDLDQQQEQNVSALISGFEQKFVDNQVVKLTIIGVDTIERDNEQYNTVKKQAHLICVTVSVDKTPRAWKFGLVEKG